MTCFLWSNILDNIVNFIWAEGNGGNTVKQCGWGRKRAKRAGVMAGILAGIFGVSWGAAGAGRDGKTHRTYPVPYLHISLPRDLEL